MTSLALFVPLAAVVVAAAVRRPDRRVRAAALFGFVAAGIGIAGLNALAAVEGWWRFAPTTTAFQGVPIDLWLGWAVLWGALPVLVGGPVVVMLGALALIDVASMPRLEPSLALGASWLVGEAVGLVAVALPAVLLGRWMAAQRHLTARVALQFLTFVGLTLWLVPSVAIAAGDGSWRYVTGLPRWQLGLLLQVAAVLALPGVLAVRELAERGGGTPYPWDPPTRLVTTGPYAFVANPMQISAVALLLLTAAATHSLSVAAAAGAAVAFSRTVAGPHEHEHLTRRHGAAWSGYRRRVRAWWPRWRPDPPRATVYLADTCDVCSRAARAVAHLRPVGVRLRPAEWHVERLRRARYEGHDGYRADGVAALARTLEHVNLAWAAIGWSLRLPGVDRLVQLLADAAGAGPRDIPHRRAHGGHAVEAPRRRDADHP